MQIRRLLCGMGSFKVVNGREPPAQRLSQEAVIPQMVVHIVHAHIEDHARPEFMQVFHGVRTFRLKHRGHIHITHMLAVPGLKQAHGRDERNTVRSPAVEALHKKGVLPRHFLELDFRGADARPARQPSQKSHHYCPAMG